MTAPDVAPVLAAVAELSARFAAERARRQHRRDLDPADFSALLATGFGRLMIPRAHGGLFDSPACSVRGVARVAPMVWSSISSRMKRRPNSASLRIPKASWSSASRLSMPKRSKARLLPFSELP